MGARPEPGWLCRGHQTWNPQSTPDEAKGCWAGRQPCVLSLVRAHSGVSDTPGPSLCDRVTSEFLREVPGGQIWEAGRPGSRVKGLAG